MLLLEERSIQWLGSVAYDEQKIFRVLFSESSFKPTTMAFLLLRYITEKRTGQHRSNISRSFLQMLTPSMELQLEWHSGPEKTLTMISEVPSHILMYCTVVSL